MSAWTLSSLVSFVLIGALVGIKLAVWHRRFSWAERLGLGLIGAGSIMTIGPLLTPGGSPFVDWAPLLRNVGLILLFTGHIIRYWKAGFPEVTK